MSARANRWPRPARVWAAASALLLIAGVLAVWSAQRATSGARSQLERVLRERYGLDVHVGAAELELASWSVSARDIEIRHGSRTLLRGGRLQARPVVGALLRGRLQLEAVRFSAASLRLQSRDVERLESIQKSDALAAFTLTVDQVALELAALGTVTLDHAAIQLNDGTAELRLEATRAVVRREQETIVTGKPSLRAKLDQPARAELQLSAASLRGHAVAGALQASCSWDRRQLSCESHWPLSNDVAIPVAFQLVREAADGVRMQLRPVGMPLEAVLGALDLAAAPLTSRVSGVIELRPDRDASWLGSARLTLVDLQLGARAATPTRAARPAWLSLPQLKAAGELELRDGRLQLRELRLGLPSGDLIGRAELALAGEVEVAAELAGDSIELRDLGTFEGVSVAGRGRVGLSVRGAASAPQLTATLALEDAALAGVALGRLRAQLEWSAPESLLRIARAELSGGGRQLHAAGLALTFDRGLAGALGRIGVLRLPLSELYALLGVAPGSAISRLSAAASGSADLAYERDGAKRGLVLGLALQLADPALSGYRFDRGRLQAKIAIPDPGAGLGAGSLALERLTLSAADGELQFSGSLRHGLRVAVRRLPLARLPWLQAHLPGLAGRIDGAGVVGDGEPAPGLKLSLSELQLAGRPLAPVALQIGAGDCGHARAAGGWSICGTGLKGSLQLALQLGAGEDPSLRGHVTLTRFALTPFLPELAPGSRLPGRLSARLDIVSATASQPQRLTGTLRVEQLELGAGELQVQSAAAFELQIASGTLSLRDAKLEGPKQRYALAAQGVLGSDAQLSADGRVAAHTLTRSIEPLFHAYGDVGVRLEWRPFTDSPFKGQAQLREVVLQVGSELLLRDFAGTLTLRDRALQLDGIGAQLGGGRFSIDGRLGLVGLQLASYQLKLRAASVALEPQSKLEVVLDADNQLTWSGPGTVPLLTGRVTLKRLLYGRSFQLQALSALQKDGASKNAERVRFDLTLAHEAPLRVRNSSLDAELAFVGPQHTLQMLGTDQHPGLLGRVEITRGRVLFQGESFNVTRGEASFDERDRIAPSFEVRALAERPRRPDARLLFSARGDRHAFDVSVRCDGLADQAQAPPFTCDYARDRMRCDSLDQLAALWACRARSTLSHADGTR